MWTIWIMVGHCMGLWCDITTSGPYSTWEECDRERAAIVQTAVVAPKKTMVVQCKPATTTEESE
jgi:hypothetical protein